MKYALLALVALAGAGIPIQMAANKRLETVIHSPVLATALAFLIGAVFMGLLASCGVLGRGSFSELSTAPWWAWIGGILSATVVLVAVVALPKAGAETVVAATVLGQLLAAAVIDHFGWFGVKQNPLTVWRISGAVIVFVGVVLMQKK